eukprot:scaffold67181_cov33-Phaeocystis_antarctica.AAC.1
MGRDILAGRPTPALFSTQAPISGALFHPLAAMSKARRSSLRPASWRSEGPRACMPQSVPEHASGQSMPQAAPSSGPPRPISQLGGSGRPHWPCFRPRLAEVRSMAAKVLAVFDGYKAAKSTVSGLNMFLLLGYDTAVAAREAGRQ